MKSDEAPLTAIIADGLEASVDGRGYDANHHAAFTLANLAPDLLDAARYAAEVLGAIPAFGDSIGTVVSKAQLGAAHNALKMVLAKL